MSPQTSSRGLIVLAGLVLATCLSGCATPATRHPVAASDIGVPSRSASLKASLETPGSVTFQQVAFARWTAGRGTFIDRDDPRTRAVDKGFEEATIYAYVIDHPRFGRVLIDSGVSADLDSRLNWVMRRAVRDLDIKVNQTTAQWLRDQAAPRAVFLTHLHFDHIGGLIDLPRTTVVYVGAGEAEERSRANTLLGHPADAILEGFGPLREWAFQPDPDGVFEGVLDVFGDGSVWAIRVPGHSPGSTAYLINAVGGPKLVVGDAISTRLGWDEGMPQPVAAATRADADASADRLRRFAAAHPGIEVFLGHQLQTDRTDLPRTAPTAASGF
jgi:glyoxylase-like metal-dependent hydrolase (beta-lactamase superfamily II)